MAVTIKTLIKPSVGSRLKSKTSIIERVSALEFLSLIWPWIRCDYVVSRDWRLSCEQKHTACTKSIPGTYHFVSQNQTQLIVVINEVFQ